MLSRLDQCDVDFARVDRFWMEKKEFSGFSPPDRPRQWKKMCFELLRKSVKDRSVETMNIEDEIERMARRFSIEGNQLETREEHKYWLTRHLEMCRQIFLRDFQIITVNTRRTAVQ
jgi:hypothetical protein